MIAIIQIVVGVWGLPPATLRAQQNVAVGQTEIVQQVEFRDLALDEALRMLSRQTTLNVVASKEAGKTKVSLFLRNVSARTVIQELCRANGLWYRRDEATGVYRVMTVSEFQQDLTLFRESETRIFSVMYPNALSIATGIQDLYGDRVKLSIGGDEAMDESRDIMERFNRFDILDQRSQGIGLFGPGGTTEYSGSQYGRNYRGSSGYYSSSGSNRRTNRGQVPSSAYEELRPLTVSQAEAVSEATEQRVAPADEHTTVKDLGKRPASIYVRVIRENNLIVVRTSDRAAMDDIAKLIQRLDVPTPTVLLEVKVLSIRLGDGVSSIFDYQFSDGSKLGGGFTSGDIIPSPSDVLDGTERKFGSMLPGGTGVEQRDLIFQFVNGSFRARMQLLEDRNRVTELATPLLLTANNEVSRLFVGEERPIVRNISSQVVVNDNTTTVSPNTTIEFRPVGTTLLLTPNINADRTVTLRILQENSRIVPGGATIPVITSNGNVTTEPVDVVATRTLSGTVVAKDGLMLAVGGLIEEGVMDQREQVPILGRVPVLGFFFRRQNTGRSHNELVIMIRPHVLTTPAEAETISQDLVKDLSIHPDAPSSDRSMGTYKPDEVLRPVPPETPVQSIFRFHSVTPADY